MHSASSHLWFGVTFDLAGEGDRHALEDFVVLELLVESRRHPLAGGVLVVLHVVVRLLHGRTLQAELDLTDQPLLEAGHFVLLQAGGRGGRGSGRWKYHSGIRVIMRQKRAH